LDLREDSESKRPNAVSLASTGLSVSVVTYAPDFDQLRRTLSSLRIAADYVAAHGPIGKVTLRLVDNGPGDGWRRPLEVLLAEEWECVACGSWEILFLGRNVGFGMGHNAALEGLNTEYHLVLNPDVVMAEDALAQAISFMKENPDVGLLTPLAVDGSGKRQYLCKRYPAVLDLCLRGFMPRCIQSLFEVRLARYEMRGITEQETVKAIPIASGCFMFFRRSVLNAIGNFSSRFFLYFEDFDLSIRVNRISSIAYAPTVRIIHSGGSAARKGIQHVLRFARSALTFYRTHAWKWL